MAGDFFKEIRFNNGQDLYLNIFDHIPMQVCFELIQKSARQRWPERKLNKTPLVIPITGETDLGF